MNSVSPESVSNTLGRISAFNHSLFNINSQKFNKPNPIRFLQLRSLKLFFFKERNDFVFCLTALSNCITFKIMFQFAICGIAYTTVLNVERTPHYVFEQFLMF